MTSDFPTIPADLARQIRLVIFDVDGVLTDGGVYVGAPDRGEPVELKRFDIQDGIGLKMLGWAGLGATACRPGEESHGQGKKLGHGAPLPENSRSRQARAPGRCLDGGLAE